MARKNAPVSFITSKSALRIGGVKRAMLDYLDREGFIRPSGPYERGRGRRRLYTYSDLVTLRLVRDLLAGGIEIIRLKEGLVKLRHQLNTLSPSQLPLRLLVTDGKDVYLPQRAGILLSLNKQQYSFSFVINIRQTINEVDHTIEELGGWDSIAVNELGHRADRSQIA